ncbi:MAG: carbohydrate-binding domain-containing protein [Ruminococcus flavefaciens]|nr:carbohydrate-binding domain-containing protein [Ruminococcus flavefaciens]MCM1230352.1 carbohydrate-binding domain-containing protein [Ruminococcus flavefaciens]
MKKSNKKLITAFSAVLLSALSLTAVSAQAEGTLLYGDANEDGVVDIADAAAIIQSLGNKDKYALSPQGADNADVYARGDGVTGMDALAIQKLKAGLIESLPESWLNGNGNETPATDGTKIHLNGDSATVEGDYAEVNGGVVTISHSGSFYIDGTLTDGQINVNIADEVADPETVKLFLNGVNITGKSAPAIMITNAENTSINIMDGTENVISDGDTAYSGDWLGCAVIEAKDDITIKGGDLGNGTLDITANTQDGIVCNNDIKINGGITTITTLNSADKTDGIKGKKSVTVKSGTLNVDAEGDGIKSSKGSVAVQGGTVNIKAGNDAVQAETTIDISGGTVIAGGDRGLTAVTGTAITGGTVIATATDNQTDASILSATQGTMLLNCVASSETDGCWKKANALTVGDVNVSKWQKKYAYVLISDSSIKADGTYKLTNASTSANATTGGSADFKMTGSVTVFDSVNPASDGTATDTPVDSGTYSITLNGTSIQSNAPADTATVENGVLTIKQAGVYAVSGEAKDVQIVVKVDKTANPDSVVELDLMGADISNSTTAPIYVESIGDEVQIVAKAGTVNTISDGTSHTQTYTDSDGNVNTVEGAVFARDDIKFKGSGTLTINGNTDDAVVCKNDIKIYNGNITVNAVDDGIRGKDSVTIGNDTATDYSGLNLTVKTQQGDGIKSTATDSDTKKQYGIVTINGGTVNINSYADGIQAEQDVVINGGDITIYTYQGSGFTGSGSSSGSTGGWGFGGGFGGGMQEGNSNKTDISAKGIKSVGLYDTAGTTWQSGGNITVNGGKITIDSSDDSLHCGGQMNINGGVFKLASADDAMHSDHDLILGTKNGSYSDFEVYVTKCYEGIEGGNIYQYSGTVAIKSDDDGYNAAGGADGSGSGNNMGWGQGGFGGGMGGSSGNILQIEGGIAIVQSASGDHDAFDSNGPVNISGGIIIANGQEPIDCGDGYSESITGGTVIECSSQVSGSVQEGTQFTVADSSGNVIVSFTTMRAMGSPSFTSGSGMTCYTGGTITGATDLVTSDDSMKVYANGSISGGSAVSAGSSGGNQGNNKPR